MSRITSFLFAFVLLCSSLFFAVPSHVEAQDMDYDFLISDQELQDANSMSRDDIQRFLNNQSGILNRLRTKDYRGVIRPAADIIYLSAQMHQINPQYLLTLLQKEQSLISATRPTRKQVDWATGYAVCDSCYFSSPALQAVKGFGMQVHKAGAILRWYYDHVGQYGWIKQPGKAYFVDGRLIRPKNKATAFLYTYTPHLQGNQNFMYLYSKWFGKAYHEGSLVKTIDDNRVFIIRKGKKYPFANDIVLDLYHPEPTIQTVLPHQLTQYPTADTIDFPPFSLLFDTETKQYFLMDYNQLRPFTNKKSFQSKGYHPDELIAVTSKDIAHLTQGTPIP